MISMRIGALVLLATTLAGCGGGNEAELRTWMDDTRKTMRPTTQPVPEPKQFTPFSYEAKGADRSVRSAEDDSGCSAASAIAVEHQLDQAGSGPSP